MRRPFGFGRMWRRRAGLAAWGGAITWAVAASFAAHGEDDRLVDDAVENRAGASPQSVDVDLGENFDRNAFDAGSYGGSTALTARSRPPDNAAAVEPARAAESPTISKVRALAEPQFKRIAAMVDLSEPQARKLRLALESEIIRASDEIELHRRKYLGVVLSGNWQQDPKQRQLMEQWQKDIGWCRDRMRQSCGDGSFFAKAVPTTLDADQHARLADAIDGRLDCLWRSIVALQMLRFDASLGLDQRQHEALEALLVETRPALQHVFGTAGRIQLHADTLIRLAVLEIGNERLRAAVSERQAQALWEFARQAQAAARRQFLESQGVLQKKAS